MFRKYNICNLFTELETLTNETEGLSCSSALGRVLEIDDLEETGEIADNYFHAIEYSEAALALDLSVLQSAGSPYWEYFLYFMDKWRDDWSCIYYGQIIHDEIGQSNYILSKLRFFLKVTFSEDDLWQKDL